MAKIPWRMDIRTLHKFYQLTLQLREVEEETEEWYAVSEEIRSLPGCPYGTDGDEDEIDIVLVDKIQTGYTGEPKIVIARD